MHGDNGKVNNPPGDFKGDELPHTDENATAPPPDDLPTYDQYLGKYLDKTVWLTWS